MNINKELTIKLFNNEKFGEVRVVNIDNVLWFVAKDITNSLGCKNSSKAISIHVNQDDRRLEMITQLKDENIIKTQANLINKNGLYSLISSIGTTSCEYKTNFIKWLTSKKLIPNQDFLLIKSRKEIEFVEMIEQSLRPFNLKGIKQYQVLDYKIDYYISKLNIAIEYDENNHSNYTYEQHEGRQKEIEKELGCKFIRVNDKKSDAYNTGYVLKNIMCNMVA